MSSCDEPMAATALEAEGNDGAGDDRIEQRNRRSGRRRSGAVGRAVVGLKREVTVGRSIVAVVLAAARATNGRLRVFSFEVIALVANSAEPKTNTHGIVT